MKKLWALIAAITVIFFLSYCNKEDDSSRCEPGNERFSYASFPLDKLSDYDFFEGDLALQNPTEDILPYKLISTLFTDYALKKRFIYIPEGSPALYVDDHELLDMPDGTIIIKTFYYTNVQPDNSTKIIETRLLYKINGDWKFADYVWNETQEEAFLDLDGSNQSIQFENEQGDLTSVDYRIPSEVECKTCHKNLDFPIPIGPKPQNLNMTYAYADGEMNQLEKWVEFGFLEDNVPSSVQSVADWKDETASLTDRVRGYLDINCAHCHKEESHCDYRPMRFAWNESDIDANLGICVEPADIIDPFQLFVVAPGNSGKSMLYFRLNNTDPAQRMPLLGRTIIHNEAIELIDEWIQSLEIICN